MLKLADIFDYAVPHFVLALTGGVLCLWVMQLMAIGHIGENDTALMRFVRRLSVATVGGGMLWSLVYGLDRAWQPWPPYLVVMVGINVMMGMAVVSFYRKPIESASTEVEIQQATE